MQITSPKRVIRCPHIAHAQRLGAAKRRLTPRSAQQHAVPPGSDGGGFAESAKRFVRSTTRDLGKKASEVGEQINSSVEEAYKEADRKFSISTWIRHVVTDARRNYPYWKKRFSDFSGTPLGKVTLWGALFYSISSGILFKLLNLFFILWWTLPLLALPFAGRIKKAQEERAAKAARDAEEAANPFSAFSSQFGGAARAARAASGRKPQGGGSRYRDDDGPVIEAEYTTIDEEDSKKRQ